MKILSKLGALAVHTVMVSCKHSASMSVPGSNPQLACIGMEKNARILLKFFFYADTPRTPMFACLQKSQAHK